MSAHIVPMPRPNAFEPVSKELTAYGEAAFLFLSYSLSQVEFNAYSIGKTRRKVPVFGH